MQLPTIDSIMGNANRRGGDRIRLVVTGDVALLSTMSTDGWDVTYRLTYNHYCLSRELLA